MLRRVLEREGFLRIESTTDPREAASLYVQHRPDLILLDLHMPGLDGFGVVREIRLDSELAATPVVALTASAMQGDRERAMSAGFTGYISKPISLRALRSEVERLLAKSSGY